MTTHRYEVAKRVTFVNAGINTVLSFFKILVGYFGHSHALLADGLHSLSDLICDALVLIAAKIGGRVPDKEHPYGHQRVETIAAMMIALLLLAVGLSIIYDAAVNAVHHPASLLIHAPLVIAAAVFSMAIKEWLYRYTLSAGKKIHSNLLITNAYHNRSDVFVSLLVLVSVTAAWGGVPYADNISAAIIALLIIKTSIQLFANGIRELIDTGVSENTLREIHQVIIQQPGVISIHQLRTRLHGGNIFIDAHIIVSPYISVSEGHHIGELVHAQLIKNFPEIADVTVHIDHENDEISKPSLNLPTRLELTKQLQQCWEHLPGYKQIEDMRLHFINGQIYVEIYWPANIMENANWPATLESYQREAKQIDHIAKLDFFVRI